MDYTYNTGRGIKPRMKTGGNILQYYFGANIMDYTVQKKDFVWII